MESCALKPKGSSFVTHVLKRCDVFELERGSVLHFTLRKWTSFITLALTSYEFRAKAAEMDFAQHTSGQGGAAEVYFVYYTFY